MADSTLKLSLVPPPDAAVSTAEVAEALGRLVAASLREGALGDGVEVAADPTERSAEELTWIARLDGRSVHVPSLRLGDAWSAAVSLAHALHQCRAEWVTPAAVASVCERSGLDEVDAATLARHLAARGVSLERVESLAGGDDPLIAAERISTGAAPALRIALSPDLTFPPEHCDDRGLLNPEAAFPDLADLLWNAVGMLLPEIRVEVGEALSSSEARLVVNDVGLPPERLAAEDPESALMQYVAGCTFAQAPSLMSQDTSEFLLNQLGQSFPIPAETLRAKVPLHLFTAALRSLVRAGGDLTDLLGVVEAMVEAAAEISPGQSAPEKLIGPARPRLGCGISGRVVTDLMYVVTLVRESGPFDDVRAARLVARVAAAQTMWHPAAGPTIAVVVHGPDADEVGEILRPSFPDVLVRGADELPGTVRVHELVRLTL